ncbi:carboxypeptidase-like regulatory domain-containing protein [Parapedobacter sp. GCM10030251]|uniref:carboxypeptidase-like regulatory domain-containing protein n=1 Tax=Parapedobacter sp. GCM10030251 TaxID=3273419 RepID=UPI00361D1416
MEKGKVDIGLIKRYLRGELSPREMYALERQAQDDPALMDIILGMEGAPEDVHEGNLEAIRKRMVARTGQGRVRRLSSAQRWAIAASILVAFTLSTWWFTQWRSFEQTPATASVPPEVDEQLGTDERQRLERYAVPESSDETTTAEQAPQSEEPASPDRSDRIAMQTEKQAQSMDTADETVVVVDYGTQKKSELIGAVASKESAQTGVVMRTQVEEIDTQAQLNERALAARAPGIQLHETGRKATDSSTSIRIRGVSRHGKPDTITGKVVDAETQKPLSGVTVELAENHTVITDSSGLFAIKGPIGGLNAEFLGYELQGIKIADKDTIILLMEPSRTSLDETVVVGYGAEVIKPEPLAGWRAYHRYLKRGVGQAGGFKGTVHLTFTIDDNGCPIDIQLVQATDPTLGKRVTELVSDGPKWKLGKNGERKAELQATF